MNQRETSPRIFLSKCLLAVMAVTMVMFASAHRVEAFDSGFTNRAVADGNARLERCRAVDKAKRNECVGGCPKCCCPQDFRKTGLSPGRADFQGCGCEGESDQGFTRKAAAALNAAKKTLLRATGQARPHYRETRHVDGQGKERPEKLAGWYPAGPAFGCLALRCWAVLNRCRQR